MGRIVLTQKRTFENEVFNYPLRFVLNTNEILWGDIAKPLSILTFKNCIFNREISFTSEGETEFTLDISFFGCIIDSISTGLLTNPNIGFYFGGCNIKHAFLKQKPQLKTLRINNSIGNIFIENFEKLSIDYTNENFFSEYCSTIKNKRRNTGSIKAYFNIRDVTKINYYSNFYKNDNYPIKGKLVKNSNPFFSNYIYQPTYSEVYSLKVKVHLSFSNEFISDFKLMESYLDSLSISGSLRGDFKLINSEIDKIYLKDVSSISGSLRFFEIKPVFQYSEFDIHNSDLSNAWFDNIDFSKYFKTSFYKSSFAETRFTSVTFFKHITEFEKLTKFAPIENIHYSKRRKKENYYKDQYEIFLQLKQSMQKTGNSYESLKMQQLIFNSLEKVNDVSKLDKFILRLNRISNNHGTNPKLALV